MANTEGCVDPIYTTPLTPSPLPDPDDCCSGGGGGGGGEGHKYTFVKTATGWQVREDGKVVFTYADIDTNTTYVWQATTEGWLVKDNKGNVLFTYKDKDTDTTYSFEKKDDCGFKVTNSKGEVVFDYDNDCAGTTYKFEQDGVDVKVTDNKTGVLVFTYKGTKDTTYNFEDYKKGFKVTDSNGTVAYIYDPVLGDPSDGSYAIDTLLTTVIKGHTTISTGQIIGFTPADLVVGETLVYDGVGTVGVITKDNGDGTYEVTTMTISPGSRQGVRLGSVKKEENLPATCAAAEALGWQTPQLGDFAYVTEGGQGDEISEYVITSLDDDCNITWTFSHSFNAGDYQAQSTTGMSGMILTGGAVQGTFGDPIDPSTLIRGVKRNGVLLTPDAQGKVNVIVDDSHIIVNALPTTNIVDLAEYVVIDADEKVVGTWVHDPRGWFQTYEPVKAVKAHQVVTALPTTSIEEYVEYVVVDADNKVTGTWVYDPTKGWLQTEVLDKPAHIVVKDLPTTGIDDEAEYIQVSDLDDPVNTYVASWVHTDKGWVKVAENQTATAAHIAVTALPTTNINENAEYVVLTDLTKPDTYQGTWVRVKNNWVQTDRLENGYHIVTSLPTSNIDDKNGYIVVEDLTKPDETLIGHYAYDSTAKKWISLSSKYEIYRGVSLNGYTISADDLQEVPVGAQISWMNDNIPKHYLLCDGTEYNIGQYPELEAFIIESKGKVNFYGGNGTTTWAVPNLMGEFLRGAYGTASKTRGAGAAVGVHQDPTLISNVYAGNKEIVVGQTAGAAANEDWGNASTGNWCNVATSGPNPSGSINPNKLSIRPTNTSTNWIIKAESTLAIVPNSDYKTTIKFNGATALSGNTTVGTITNANVTAKLDDTALWNTAGYFVAPVDGYYDMSVFASNTTSLPATSAARFSVWFLSKLPSTSAWSEMKDFAYTANQTGDMSTQPSVLMSSTSANVRLNKGDKVYIVFTNGWQNTTMGHATFALSAPVSRTQVNTAEAMMKPNTWQVGVEQDFGDGVYGMRLKGTTPAYTSNATTASRHDFKIGSLPSTARFIQVGGNALVSGRWVWPMSSAWGMGTSGVLGYSIVIYLNEESGTAAARDLNLDINNTAASSGDQYDIWLLYTK